MKSNKILCLTIIFLFICSTQQNDDSKKLICNISSENKIDCGFVGINQKKCEEKGCCFIKSTDGSPWCYKGIILESNNEYEYDHEEKDKNITENESKNSLDESPNKSSYVVRTIPKTATITTKNRKKSNRNE